MTSSDLKINMQMIFMTWFEIDLETIFSFFVGTEICLKLSKLTLRNTIELSIQ